MPILAAVGRHFFAGGANDFVENDKTGRPRSGVTVTAWSAKTGGTPYTDLLDSTGAAVTSLTSDSGGFLNEFQGPDGVTSVWLDAGSLNADGSARRFRLFATDIVGASGYLQPAGGIPRTDMTADVRASLSKGDGALQAASNLADVANAQTARASLGLDSGGLIPPARLGTGTATSATVLYGDQTWRTPGGSGGGTSVVVAAGTSRNMFNGSSTSGSAVIGGTFTGADVGRVAYLPGAGPSGGMLVGKIASQTGSTATLTGVTASATVSGQELEIVDDMTSTLQTAINSLTTLGSYGHAYGGTVQLPIGSYALTSTLTVPSGVRLVGSGHKGSTEGFNSMAGSNLIAGVPGMTMVRNIYSSGVSQTGVAFERINFAGTSNTDRTTIGLELININRFLVRDCAFTGLATCLHLTDGAGSPTNYAGGDSAWYQVENITISRCTRGILADNNGTAGVILGGDIQGCDVSCIDFSGSAATVFRIIGLKVDHSGSGPAMKLKTYQSIVANCDFEMTSTSAIAIDVLGDAAIGGYMGTGVVLVGNEIYYGSTASVAGINLQSTTNSCNVIGNSLFNCSVVNAGSGNLLLQPATRPTVTGSRAGNAALASLLSALASIGLITNSTTT